MFLFVYYYMQSCKATLNVISNERIIERAVLISHRHNDNRWRLLTFTTQDNFLVASTNELDQPANRFCYAFDAWERLIWPRELIFRCVKSQKRVCLHFGSPTRTVIRVTLSLWVCSVQVTTKSLFIKTKITIFRWTDKVVHSWPSWWFDTFIVSDHASPAMVDKKSFKNSHSWFILFLFCFFKHNKTVCNATKFQKSKTNTCGFLHL